MSGPVTLTFLPWMRRGLTRSIAGGVTDGLPQTSPATVIASFRVDATLVRQTIRLQGPGDVAGLAPGQVLREEPPNGSQRSEPNYFPALELQDPALPWTFTPASAAAGQPLQPWLTLAAVKEQPGVALQSRTADSTVLVIESPAIPEDELPDLAEAWNWAHVETTADLSAGLAETYRAQPSAFRSRLLCPRRLEPETAYLAVLVPTFRQGVQAGLGVPADPADLTPAWSGGEVRVELPVYHSWRFRTGPSGDFESLVRRLQPVELGPDAGLRDLSLRNPGGGLPGAKRPVSFAGAIISPVAKPKPWAEAHRKPFETKLRAKLDRANKGDDSASPYNALDHDPVVAPPTYGLRQTGLAEVPDHGEPPWLVDVNLDPRHRTQAGLGARMVRRNQEKLMADAWEQVSGLRTINSNLARWTLAAEAGERAKKRLVELDASTTLQLTAPAHARLDSKRLGKTLLGGLRGSSMPEGSVSPAMRRQLRKEGPVGRAAPRAEKTADFTAKVTSRFAAAPAAMLAPQALKRPAGVSIDDGSMATRIIEGANGQTEAPSPQRRRVPAERETIARTGASRMADKQRLRRARPAAARKPFKIAPQLTPPRVGLSASVVQPSPLLAKPSGADLQLADAALSAVQPLRTIAAQARQRIQAPARAWEGKQLPARMLFAPTFSTPAYKPLLEMGLEYLMPGAETLEEDTVSAAVTNAEFVEAFLAGANHELASEFLWREFPTPLNRTWMRRFWSSGDDDIGEISGWERGRLGQHQTGPAADDSIILLIKGDLLRRYPQTVIELSPAKWEDKDRVPDPSRASLSPAFWGRLGDGLRFYGFELKAERARGSVKPSDKQPGWFFSFTEPPGDTRFGLDVGKRGDVGGAPRYWKNLSWFHMVDEAADLRTLAYVSTKGRLDGVSKRFEEGRPADAWGKHSAATARITLQRPVRVLIHADTLLADPAKRERS